MPYVRSVSMGVWVNVGARDESDAQSGLSHFIEHMIFKGTARRTAFQIAKEFDAVGGHTNAFTSMEHTCYHAKVMDTHLETMVSILSDIFLNSIFSPEEIERERPVIFQEIGMVEDTPELITCINSRETIFWGEHPLGRSILGTREEYSHVRQPHHQKLFPQILQSRTHRHRRGRECGTTATSWTWWDPISVPFPVKANCPNAATPSFACRRYAPIPAAWSRSTICLATIGLPVTDPRRYAASLLNTILGGNMSSRLFQEIREQRGLAYSVYSFMSSHADTGMFGGIHRGQPG